MRSSCSGVKSELRATGVNPAVAAAGGGGGGFAPTDIEGLVTWLDASDLTTLFQDSAKTTAVASDGDPVGAWVDKSTNGYDLIQATGAAKPTFKTPIQGNNALLLDGGDLLNVTPFSDFTTQPYTVFFVITRKSTISTAAGAVVSLGDKDVAGYWYFGIDDNQIESKVANTARESILRMENFADDVQISAFTVGATTHQQYQQGIKALDYGESTNNNAIDNLSIGATCDSTPSTYYSEYVNEVIIYDSVLSEADRQSVEAYLATKWGVADADMYGTAALTDPSTISGLEVWLDAQDTAYLYQDTGKTTPANTDLDPVGCWEDRSGNGHDVIQGTAAAKPTYNASVGGYKTLSFDGGDSLSKDPWSAITDIPATMFCVYRQSAETGQKAVVAMGGGANGTWVGISANDPKGYLSGTATLQPITYANVPLNSEMVLGLLLGSTRKAIRAQENNDFTKTVNNSSASASPAWDRLTIGQTADDTPTDPVVSGHVLEVLIFNRELTLMECSRIEEYLANRYGITIDYV